MGARVSSGVVVVVANFVVGACVVGAVVGAGVGVGDSVAVTAVGSVIVVTNTCGDGALVASGRRVGLTVSGVFSGGDCRFSCCCCCGLFSADAVSAVDVLEDDASLELHTPAAHDTATVTDARIIQISNRMISRTIVLRCSRLTW